MLRTVRQSLGFLSLVPRSILTVVDTKSSGFVLLVDRNSLPNCHAR